MDFKKDNEYICTKDMLDDFNGFMFKRGTIYTCHRDDTICDEKGNNRIYLSYFDNYFEPYTGQKLPELSRKSSIWIARDKKKRDDLAYGQLYMYTSNPKWDENDKVFFSDEGGHELYIGLFPFIKDGECVEFKSV